MPPQINPAGSDAIRYSEPQLAAIRTAIAALPSPDAAAIAERDAAVSRGDCPPRLWPLWTLAQDNPALWNLLLDDERIARFSVYGLFPAAYPLAYGPERPRVDIRYAGRTRGRVAILTHESESAGIVIKPRQSSREAEIARIAGNLGVGPAQLPTIEGFITEEFVAGPFLTDLAPDRVSKAQLRGVGVSLANALTRLHAAGVCYNDATISDPDGRSHIILRADGSIRLIDFGVALLLDAHPDGLTFEDAWNAARTDPMFRLFRQLAGNADDAALGRFVADYGRRLAAQTAPEIQSRDWRIAREGAALYAARAGAAAADALLDGLAIGG